jgi:hypothetical protein
MALLCRFLYITQQLFIGTLVGLPGIRGSFTFKGWPENPALAHIAPCIVIAP